jgi:hypothetical protein
VLFGRVMSAKLIVALSIVAVEAPATSTLHSAVLRARLGGSAVSTAKERTAAAADRFALRATSRAGRTLLPRKLSSPAVARASLPVSTNPAMICRSRRLSVVATGLSRKQQMTEA